MGGRWMWVAAAAIATLLLTACGAAESGAETAPAASADRFNEDRAFRDLEAQVDLGPRPSGSRANRRQAKMLARKLRRAGAKRVRIQKPYRNVVGTIPGRRNGFVVVGAHHDTKNRPAILGANDGASGVAVALEVARSLPRPLRGRSVAIALFDAEEARGSRDFFEDGIRGSRQYVRYARRGGKKGSPPLEKIRAMVLFDMVGDCDLQIPRETQSSEALYDLFAAAAGGAPFEGTTTAIADDHVPFLAAGIPAVDLIDFTYGSGGTPGEYWHTAEDTLDKVCPESLDAVGEAAVVAIPQIR